MKCKKLAIVAMLGILLAVITFSGCSSNSVSLADQGLVSVEKQDSRKVKILWTDIYQKGGQTWAYGVLTQRASSHSVIRTHVDIKVLNPDGSLQYETVTKA